MSPLIRKETTFVSSTTASPGERSNEHQDGAAEGAVRGFAPSRLGPASAQGAPSKLVSRRRPRDDEPVAEAFVMDRYFLPSTGRTFPGAALSASVPSRCGRPGPRWRGRYRGSNPAGPDAEGHHQAEHAERPRLGGSWVAGSLFGEFAASLKEKGAHLCEELTGLRREVDRLASVA